MDENLAIALATAVIGAFALISWLVRRLFTHYLPSLMRDHAKAVQAQRDDFTAALERIREQAEQQAAFFHEELRIQRESFRGELKQQRQDFKEQLERLGSRVDKLAEVVTKLREGLGEA